MLREGKKSLNEAERWQDQSRLEPDSTTLFGKNINHTAKSWYEFRLDGAYDFLSIGSHHYEVAVFVTDDKLGRFGLFC